MVSLRSGRRPIFYDANDYPLSASNRSVRHLFTGQQWYQEVGLYDLRNRFYSPDVGRFLQPDPIGFGGGNNLYRYCDNNPVTRGDPFGLQDAVNSDDLTEGWYRRSTEVSGQSPIRSILAERAPLLGVAEAAGVAKREEEEAV